MTEYTPEAEALGRVLWPGLQLSNRMLRNAQRAIDAGWTPPPDPHEDIARELYAGMFTSPWNPERSDIACDLLAAVRRIPDHLARDVAEALRGES